MKTIIAAILLMVTAAAADEITVTLSGSVVEGSKVISTNEVTFGRFNWDGIDGGGQHEITAVLDGNRVVVTERTISSSWGFGNDTTSKNFIPTNKIPFTFTLSQTTVTVSRAESTPSNEPDKQPQQGGPGYPPQGVGSPDP